MYTTKTATDLIEQGMDAFNTGDRTRFSEILADDVIYREYASELVLKGRDAVLDHLFGVWRKVYPDHHGEIIDILPGETKIGMEAVWTGTQRGELITPLGTFPPTGKTFRLPAFMVFTLNNGKVTEMRHFWDSAMVLRQLGLIPEFLTAPTLIPA